MTHIRVLCNWLPNSLRTFLRERTFVRSLLDAIDKGKCESLGLSSVLYVDIGEQSLVCCINCLLIHLRNFRLSSFQDAEVKVLLWKEISKQVHRLGRGHLGFRKGGAKRYILIKM